MSNNKNGNMEEQTVINPKYEFLRTRIEAIPQRFDEGKLVYGGRNEIRSFNWNGLTVVAKRFKRLGFIRRIIYTFFRDNKALRSYRNAMEIIHRSMGTPEPIAYIEVNSHGLIKDLYYLSAETQATDIKSALIDRKPWNQPLLEAYATFVAALHEKGILHHDLNPTNVLYKSDGKGGYRFTLIDVNRMTFYDGPVPKPECMENLTLFWWLTPVYRAMLDAYAACRGWTRADIAEAIHRKEVHDRRWIRRKRLTHPFKRKLITDN